MNSLATIVAGRRTAWIVLLACLIALGLGLALIPQPPATAQANPATAGDSYATAQWLSHVPAADTMNGIVVWTRSDGQPLSSAQQQAVRTPAAAVRALSPDPTVAWTQVSPDRIAMMVVAPIQTSRVLANAPAIANSLLGTARQGLPAGIRAQLTGQIAGLADNARATGAAADRTLGLWLLALAALLLILATRSVILWLVPLVLGGAAAEFAYLAGASLAGAIDVRVDPRDLPLVSAWTLALTTAFSVIVVLRLRRELALTPDRFDAGARAWTRVAPSVAVSAIILLVGALVFLFAGDLRVRALALAAIVGILIATLTALLAVPAGLALVGRPSLWMGLPATAGTPVKPLRILVTLATAVILAVGMTGAAALVVHSTATAKDTQSAQARAAIDKAFIKGYENEYVMIVPNSLAGDTSILAPTTLAMNLPDAHAVTVGPSYKGFSALTAEFDLDPGSQKSFATIGELRKLIASKGNPTATTLVGGQDPAALDRMTATSIELLALLPISIVLMVALALAAELRSRRRERSNAS